MTLSTWVQIDLHLKEFKNAHYLPQTGPNKGRITAIPLTQYKDMRVWREYFFKYTDNFANVTNGDQDWQLNKKTSHAESLKSKLEALLQRSTDLLLRT